MVKYYFVAQISWKYQWCYGKNVNGVTAYKWVFQQIFNNINQLYYAETLHRHLKTI